MIVQQPHNSTPSTSPVPQEDSELNISAYFDILLDAKWIIGSITALAVASGLAYALLAKPVYQSDLLIQVEDSSGSSAAQTLLGEASSLFDVKTPATGEIEILRSRMVVGKAVDATKLYIDAQPRYIPIIGRWLSTRATELSSPGFLGFDGYVSGKETINIAQFSVPQSLEGEVFILTLGEKGTFTLKNDQLDGELQGNIGSEMVAQTSLGTIRFLAAEINGLPGSQFVISRASRDKTVDDLQNNLQIAEKGRQSGVLTVALQDSDVNRLTNVLNEIGQQYIRQNVERKSAEAQKTLNFLDTQLPQFKKQLEESEEAYNRFRNQKGTIALDEEAKLALQQTVELQTKLFEAEQQRRALEEKFTVNHPSLQTLNKQISAWQGQISQLNNRIKGMPLTQQDSVRFQRDVQVNTELYQSLLNNSLQLSLVKEGKTGNVRLLDDAVTPTEPVKPRKPLILALSLVLGLFAGIAYAFTRQVFSNAIRNAEEIESQTGLTVYSTIPLSATQKTLAQQVTARAPGVHVLASSHPSDPSIESLRSLRTSLQFAMLESPNNRVLITGPAPGVGKSFISSNLAAVLAAGGKRILLIDADMRKGYLNQFFGIARDKGLSDVIAGSIEFKTAVHENVLPGMDFLATGTLPPNPAELLMSDSFKKLMEKTSSNYDMVIVDTPPVLVAADAIATAQTAGIVLLIARSEITYTGEVQESIKRLAQAGKHVNGILFNGVDTSRRYNGRYGYRYGGGYRYAHYDYSPTTKN